MKPTAASLERALGRSFAAHHALSQLTKSFPSEWNHSKASGWMKKVHDGKKALFYLVVLDGAFRVSLTLRARERASLLEDASMSALHGALGSAKKYAEGYALRFEVMDEVTFAPLKLVLERIIELRG
jgi:hypothetical protein